MDSSRNSMGDIEDMEAWLLRVFRETVENIRSALKKVEDRSATGQRPGQYGIDLVADAAALEVLHRENLDTLSEESGMTAANNSAGAGSTSGIVVVIDPVDGSANFARGIPWYATSLCAVDSEGPRVSLVTNLANGESYHAVRGHGAWKGDRRLKTSGCTAFSGAIVGLSGFPGRYLGWSQYRALGAAALDICLVADGVLDCYGSVGRTHLGVWDYIAAMLICEEAGGCLCDASGQDLVTMDHSARRATLAAANESLLDQFHGAVSSADVVPTIDSRSAHLQ
ncbi:MAG: inositol monophosphatase family protein [Acidimicrobiales bacterium]